MAVTKIHAIKATVHKAVDYICNPAKTDESILISSFGCSPQTAAFDFKFALSHTSEADPNKAFHLIQAFSPGEVSYKEAHQIGQELADKLLDGKYSYVVATHIDKGHVHNHIIFCAADNINHEKYHDCKRSYYHIRELSDELCREHHLSIIEPTGHGKSYPKWQEEKNQKETLKAVIDKAIRTAKTYEECMELIRASGYEIKGDNIEDSHLKTIAFRPLERERFIRGSERTLGKDYTRERIKERIENLEIEVPKQPEFPKKRKPLIKDYSGKKLIDTTEEKFAQSSGLKHWADIQNLKIAAASYSAAKSLTDLQEQISKKSAVAKSARSSVVDTEHKLKDLGLILKYAKQYQDNRIYKVRYNKSKDKDAYLRRRETELLLYSGAENMLKQLGINPKILDLETLQKEYNLLYQKKLTMQQTYKSAEKEIAKMQQQITNIQTYLQQDFSAEKNVNMKEPAHNQSL